MSMPTGSTATGRPPGTLALKARLTAAVRSTNGRTLRVMTFERGWKRSLPCRVTSTGPSRASTAGQAVRPKWAWTTSKRGVGGPNLWRSSRAARA